MTTGKTDSGTVVRVDVGPFSKAIVVVLASLFAAGVLGLFGMRSEVTRQTVKIDTFQEWVKTHTEQYTTTQGQVKALEILMERFNSNHDVMRRDVDELRDAWDEYVKRTEP